MFFQTPLPLGFWVVQSRVHQLDAVTRGKDRRELGVTFLMLWQCSADRQCQGHVDIYSSS